MCNARLSWRSPKRFSRYRSVRPDDTGNGAAPDSIPKAASLWIRPAWDHDSRIYPRLRHPDRARRQPGREPVPDELSDLRSEFVDHHGQVHDPLARPGQAVMQHPGLAVSVFGSAQLGEHTRATIPCQPRGAAQATRSGAVAISEVNTRPCGPDTLHGVVPVNHQHPQCFPVTVGAHLARVGAGQGLLRRTDSIDRITLALRPLPDTMAAVDLDHTLALIGQEPLQPQPIWRVPSIARTTTTSPAATRAHRHLRIPSRGGRHPTLGQRSATDIAQRGGVGVDPTTNWADA